MTLKLIQELIQNTPYNVSSFHWVQAQPPKDFELETLVAYPHRAHLGAILSNVPPTHIIKTFGKEFMFWLWLHAEYEEKQDQIVHAYADATEKDWILLQTIRKALQEIGVHQDPFHVKKAYDTVACLEDAVAGINTQILLQQYTMSNIPEDAYSVIPLRTPRGEIIGSAKSWKHLPGRNDSERVTISLDAMMGITLLYKNIPQAVCSFFPTNTKTLMIYQLQGIRYEKTDPEGRFAQGGAKRLLGRGARGLFRLDWQAFLVAYTTAIARYNEFSCIGIRSGQFHPMTRKCYDNTKEVHLPLEKALDLYDGIAARLGFLQEKNKNWYKDIS